MRDKMTIIDERLKGLEAAMRTELEKHCEGFNEVAYNMLTPAEKNELLELYSNLTTDSENKDKILIDICRKYKIMLQGHDLDGDLKIGYTFKK